MCWTKWPSGSGSEAYKLGDVAMHPDVQGLVKQARAPLNGEARGEESVLLAPVLEEIEALILRFITLPANSLAMLTACWIAGTYLYERFSFFGYLALRSATPRCGKSHLLRLIALVANGSPPIIGAPTAAVLFRSS